MRIKVWGYDSEWRLGDLIPFKGMRDHFRRNENTQISLEDPTTLLNTIPDFTLLFSYNAGLVIGSLYAAGHLMRLVYQG